MENLTETGGNAHLLRGAVYANSFKPIATCVRSTGFRTNALRYRDLEMSELSREGEAFLLRSMLRRHDRETERSIANYFTDETVVMLSLLDGNQYVGLPRVELPTVARLELSLGEAIGWRRSVRTYTGDSIPLDQLTALVLCSAGVTCHVDVELHSGGESTLSFRSAASGGGLYPVSLLVAALRVDGLPRGVYRYDPSGHCLVQVNDPSAVEALLPCFAVSDDALSLSRASAIFMMIARPWRSMRKYGDRGLRYIFIEAGEMAAHINLAAVALGLGSVDCASIYEDEAHRVLELDGLQEAIVHTVVVGVPG